MCPEKNASTRDLQSLKFLQTICVFNTFNRISFCCRENIQNLTWTKCLTLSPNNYGPFFSKHQAMRLYTAIQHNTTDKKWKHTYISSSNKYMQKILKLKIKCSTEQERLRDNLSEYHQH